jgi:hypothetical protein
MLAAGNHYSEFREAVAAGLPYLFAALALSLFLLGLSAVPPSVIPIGPLARLLDHRRLQIAVLGMMVPVGTLLGFLVVYWAL